MLVASCELLVKKQMRRRAVASSFRRSRPATGNQQLATSYHGFTLIELSIGLVIMSMIMLGVAAIMTSVAQGWEDGRVTQSTQMQANQVYARVQKILSSAKYVILPTDGSTGSSILFWANDNLIADSTAEAGELALIERDSNTNTLYLYQAAPNLSGAQLTAAQTQLNWSSLQAVTASQLKGWSYMQPTAIAGPGSSGNANALQVSSTQFYVTGLGSTSVLPLIEFSLGLSKNGQSVTLYNSSTLRSPTTQPQ